MKKRKVTGKNIIGFTIPEIILSEKEKEESITLERIYDFHRTVGEDFMDCFENILGKNSVHIYSGYLLAKYPNLSEKIFEIINSNNFWSDYQDLFLDDFLDNEKNDIFYFEMCNLINLTINSKRRANVVLFSIKEFYKK